MTIGIGVTSYNRPEMLNKFIESLKKYSTYEHKLHVAIDTDEDRKGVAKMKNECLRALKHCDHIFLFDDDVEIIKKGWEDFFINSGEEHLLFLRDSHVMTGYLISPNDKVIEVYRDCGGVFMYLTKNAVDKVGAFNEDFTPYAFEHAEYSQRVFEATAKGWHMIRTPYRQLVGTGEYLYAEDYSNPNHKSSITDAEKNKHIKAHWDKFIGKEIKTIYRPL